MFWKDRRVFLTGHTGFQGAWLALWLEQLGAAVTGFALAPSTRPSLFAEAAVGSGVTSILGDIRHLDGLRETMRQAEPELVMHLAGHSLARATLSDPTAAFSTNVMGTANVLEAARACPSIRAILIVTSDDCYQVKPDEAPYRESDPLGGADPIQASKACAELVADSYRATCFSSESFAEHRVAVATMRAGNIIGGGDWASGRLLPDAVRALSAGAPLRLRNPHTLRPWQHVLEPLRGYLMLAHALIEESSSPDGASPNAGAAASVPSSTGASSNGTRKDGAWNFGPGPDALRTVEAAIDCFARRWNYVTRSRARWEIDRTAPSSAARVPSLDCTRARAELDWQPVLSFAEAVGLTAEWYGRHRNGEDARALSIEQIARYREFSARLAVEQPRPAPPQRERRAPETSNAARGTASAALGMRVPAGA